MKPSSRPMMSSWRDAAAVGVEGLPRLEADVVAAALGVGQADPLAGAAAARGVRRTSRASGGSPAIGTLLEGTVHVGGGEHAADGRRRPRRGRTPRPGWPTWRGPGPPPRCRRAAAARPRWRAGDRVTGTHGAAVLGRRQQRGLADDAAEPVVADVHDDRPGPGLLRPAYGLADRQVVGDGDARGGPAGAPSATGSRRRTRALTIEAVAPDHRKSGDHDGDHVVDDVGLAGRRTRAAATARTAPARRHAGRPSRRRWCRGGRCR